MNEKFRELQTDFEKMKQRNDVLEEENRIRKQSDDSSQDKKVKNLQKQLQASKKNAKKYKDYWESIKQSFGISPFNGEFGVHRS